MQQETSRFTHSHSSISLQSNSSHSLRAVTVRQILNATQMHSEAEIMVDGAEVGHVSANSSEVVSVAITAELTSR
jgi:hypothetical protein